MNTTQTIDLEGLEVGQPQVWRAIRIVPLLRATPIEDLRLDQRCYDNAFAHISLPDRTVYTALIPHAFVARWSTGGAPAPVLGSHLASKPTDVEHMHLRIDVKMAKRESRRSLRFLPLHTALEGYLALHFKGPPPDAFDYTREARTHGLSPRVESAIPAHWIPGIEDAIRFFEIQDRQVGALYFVADSLAAAFVLPHPDDYAQLHRSVLRDTMGELVHQYGCAYPEVGELIEPLDHDRITELADIERELEATRSSWRALLQTMTAGLTARPSTCERIYRMGRHQLSRFLPEFRPGAENHIGEVVWTKGAGTAYLKTFRLSEAQVRRGFLLSRLAGCGWDLDACAAEFGQDRRQLLQRLQNAGFGELFAAHAWRRT